MVWQPGLFVISLKVLQALITAVEYVTPAEMSVSHDFFPGTYFWVIIQQKVLTKLEFCVNLLFPPFTACISYSDRMSSCTDNNSSALLESLSVHRTKELEPISDFWKAPGAPGDHLC